jgi:preprotein translocase subunit SecG
MYGFLLFLLVLDGAILTLVVLLQSGKGGGLAAMGGGAAATEGILGGRQAVTILTRTTWITGGAFMVLSLVLAILSSRAAGPTSILRQTTAPAAAPAPLLPGAQGGAPAAGTPETGTPAGGAPGTAAPGGAATPAPTTPPSP